MIARKRTSRGRVRLPQAVLTALDLREGDHIAYRIDGRRVTMTSAVVDPFAAFDEWTSSVDYEAYADL